MKNCGSRVHGSTRARRVWERSLPHKPMSLTSRLRFLRRRLPMALWARSRSVNSECPEYLCEGRIVYRPTPEEVGFYEYHRWAMNPRQAITQYVVDGLRAQSLFKSVAVHERGSEAAYVLSGNIERLEEVDQGRDVRVVCTISAQLLDARTRSVVWSHTASETVRVEKRDIRGVVSSLSAAARTAADRLLKSMTEELPATMASTGRSASPSATSAGDAAR